MDFDEILTDAFFNYGWCYKKRISFFGKENDIQFVFEAYPETEKINSVQYPKIEIGPQDAFI